MEFENWQVSNTMRELVRQENVKHELSLLAAQQEKVRKYNVEIIISGLISSLCSLRHFFYFSAKRN